jgi:ParB-like chromosome segregation protein Spo0J
MSEASPLISVPLTQLRAHPSNSNVMPAALFDKLVDHLRGHDRYPPIIVRPMPRDEDALPTYQVLDGHHRWRALEQLGRAEARCVVWDVDDAEALVLLASLNRLQGSDDPRKRAALVAELTQTLDVADLARRLPEDAEKLKKLLALHGTPPPPRPPRDVETLPIAVHFFLLPAQRRAVEQKLAAHGGTREDALLALLHCAG